MASQQRDAWFALAQPSARRRNADALLSVTGRHATKTPRATARRFAVTLDSKHKYRQTNHIQRRAPIHRTHPRGHQARHSPPSGAIYMGARSDQASGQFSTSLQCRWPRRGSGWIRVGGSGTQVVCQSWVSTTPAICGYGGTV